MPAGPSLPHRFYFTRIYPLCQYLRANLIAAGGLLWGVVCKGQPGPISQGITHWHLPAKDCASGDRGSRYKPLAHTCDNAPLVFEGPQAFVREERGMERKGTPKPLYIYIKQRFGHSKLHHLLYDFLTCFLSHFRPPAGLNRILIAATKKSLSALLTCS